MSEEEIHFTNPKGYEKRDVNVRMIGIIALLSVALIVFFVINLNDFFLSMHEKVVHEQVLSPLSDDLLKLRVEEEKILNSYALIDTVNMKYRIPLERAMELVAAEEKFTK